MLYYIDVISGCSLRCPSCPNGNTASRANWAHGMMSPDLLGKILDKAVSETEVGWICLYNWTDPLLHPNLPSLIQEVNDRGLFCHISTPLHRLDDPVALLAANPGAIQISVSGFDQEIYGRAHRGGNIEKVKNNMKALAAARAATGSRTALTLAFHLYRYNHADLVKMFGFAQELGFTVIPVLGKLMEVESIIDLYRNHDACSDDKKRVNADLLVRVDEALNVTKQMAGGPCNLIEDMVSLDVAGNVVLCCGVSPDKSNVVGPYLDTSLPEIQSARRANAKCQPCRELNISSYLNSQLSRFLA